MAHETPKKGSCITALALRHLSRHSDFLLLLLQQNSTIAGKVQVLTPPHAKGCQVSLLLPHVGRAVFNKLAEAGIFADWREPDVIRVAPVPLYNTFSEVWRFCQVLHNALENR